jgi:Tfp pilus assembly protein PilO
MNAAGLIALFRRYPYCTVCAVLTLVLAGVSWYLWGQIQVYEVARQEKTKEGEAMLALLVGGSTQRQELASAREAARRIDDNLLIEANLSDNYWYFFKLEEQTKARLEVHQLSSPQNDTSPLYKRIPFTLRIIGTYDQVAAYVLALETGPRLVNITNFSLARRDPGGNSLALDLSIELLGKK